MGVKESPDGGVQDFAISYATKSLCQEYGPVQPVERRRYGYDLIVKPRCGGEMLVEVKGQSTANDVELRDNEAKAAVQKGDGFYVFVVHGILNNPQGRLLQNPASKGKQDLLVAVPIDVWQTGREF